jgi:hypothetical protein
LLDPDEQDVLDRLSVFAGGFDLGAAQAVASTETVDPIDVLDVLARLVAKSLVDAEPRDGTTRYRLLETVRDFAWEQLQAAGATDAVARRHAEFFAQFAGDAGAGLRGPDETDWRNRVEREVDNLRAALAWAISAGDAELALRPVADLAVLGDQVAPHGRLAEDAAGVDENHPLSAIALGAACFAASLQGDVDATKSLAEDARRRAAALDRSREGLWVRCRVANATCVAAALRNEPSGDFGAEWVAAARELDDPWCLVEALTYMIGERRRGGVGAGEEALVLARGIGAPSRVAFAAALLASAVAEEDLARADQLLEEAAAAAALARNDWVDYVTSMAVISLHVAVNEPRAAADGALAAIDRSVAQRVPGHVLQWIGTLAAVLATMNDTEGALVLAAWVEQRGLILREGAFFAIYGSAALVEADEQASAAEREHFTRTAAGLDDASIIEFARSRVTDLAAEAR